MNQQTHKKAKIASAILRAGIAIDYDNLLAHCEFLIKGWASEQQRFQKLVAQESKNLSGEELANFEHWYSDDAWRLNDVFPSLQATSVFLLAYGMFEKTMNEIAREAGTLAEAKIKLSDLNGQGIERAKNFLTKLCGVNLPFASPDWAEITRSAKLRNVIAHASGELDLSKPDHKQIFEYCKTQDNITIKRYSAEHEFAEVELSLDYVIPVVRRYRTFLIELCKFRFAQAVE